MARFTLFRRGWLSNVCLWIIGLTLFSNPSSVFAQKSGRQDTSTVRGVPPIGSPRSMGASTPGYCPSIGGNTSFESISKVTWTVSGNIISFVVEIYIANPTDCISGNPCPDYDASPEFVNGWIDWNGDKIWQANERVINLALTGYSGINYSGTMTGYTQAQIPQTSVNSPIMRVNLGWSFDPNDPCEYSWQWGDVKDYTVELRKYNIDRLTVVGGNKVKEIANDIIWLQSFGVNCSIVDNRVDENLYPFSAPLSSTVQLRSRVASCPAGGDQPQVKCNWSVQGTSLRGSSSWTGWEGDVPISAPNKVGIYTVELKYEIKGEGQTSAKTIKRKLFVTWKTPLAQVGSPKRKWYEKACDWGSGQSEENAIARRVLAGLYAYGQAHWKYGYFPDRCSWQNLVEDDACNYSDCFVFSEVLENMSATLGIGGLSPKETYGSNNQGFVTRAGYPSLDPLFPGNAFQFGFGPLYDRYLFSSHSLRLKGSTYYDATFGQRYPTSTTFISWNLTGGSEIDSDGLFLTTNEGAKVYVLPGNAYDGWGSHGYTPPPSLIASIQQERGHLSETVPKNLTSTGSITFAGTAAFSTVDNDKNGIADALAADVGVNIVNQGDYVIFATLVKNQTVVANRPSWQSMKFTKANLSGAPGSYNVRLLFSGEQIYQSKKNGPYSMRVYAISTTGPEDTLSIATSAYLHTKFGEIGAGITAASDAGVDLNADGKFDYLRTTLSIAVRDSGAYRVQGGLAKDSVSVAAAGKTFSLTAGSHTLTLDFPGRSIRRAGLDGPYLMIINLVDSKGQTIASRSFTTQNYSAPDFQYTLLDLDGVHDDFGLDLNGNGKYDLLRVNFGANIDSAGTFLLTGRLQDPSSGNEFAFTDSIIVSTSGSQTLALDFSGQGINIHGSNGPYTLTTIEMLNQNHAVIDRVSAEYSTNAYNYSDFEDAPVVVTYTGVYSDHTVDLNSNGLFDALVLNMEVTSTKNGVLIGVADLYDMDGRRVVNGSGLIQVSANVAATLSIKFDGRYLFGNLRNGAYIIRNAFIYPTGDISQGIAIDSVGVTATQNYLDFERAAVITGIVENPTTPGSFATGVQIRSDETFDYVDQNGYYRLIYLANGTKTIRASDPQDSTARWNVYMNGHVVGTQDSAIVEVAVGIIDTVDFLAGNGFANIGTLSADTKSGYKKSNQSKVFHYDSQWWAIAFYEPENRWYIWRYDGLAWSRARALDKGINYRWDAVVNSSAGKLYLLGSHISTSLFRRYTYAGGTWNPDAGFPVKFSGFTNPDQVNPVCLAQAKNGELWIFRVANHILQAKRSSDEGATWSATINVKSGLHTANATTDAVAFSFGGNHYVGVAYGEQDNINSKFGFLLHRDSDPDSAWADESASLTFFGTERAHNSLSLAADANNVYLFTRNLGFSGSNPRNTLYKRTSAGIWKKHKVNASLNWKSPAVAIDATNNVLYFLGVNTATQMVECKIGHIGQESTLASAEVVKLFSIPGAAFDDLSVPSSNADAMMGLMVCVDNLSASDIWYKHILIANNFPVAINTVLVGTDEVNANAGYTIQLTVSTSGGLSAGVGTINFRFPENTFVPNGMSASEVIIDGTPATSIISNSGTRQVSVITPVNLPNNHTFSVVFNSGAGLLNPTLAGNYQLIVWTSAQPMPANSPAYSLAPATTTVTPASVSPLPTDPNSLVDYMLTFNLGAHGRLLSGTSTVVVQFATTTQVQHHSLAGVKVNSVSAIAVGDSGLHKVTITVPPTLTVDNNAAVTLFLPKPAIRNPVTAGFNTLTVATSVEATPVTSTPYEIKNSNQLGAPIAGANRKFDRQNQSKMFYHAGYWWVTAQSKIDAKWYLWKFDGISWTQSTLIHSVSKSRPECILDAATNKAYILLPGADGTTYITRLTYSGGNWTVDSGYPYPIDGFVQDGERGISMVRRTNGALWVFMLKDSSLVAKRSSNGGQTWSATTIVKDSLHNATGLTDVVGFVYNSKNFIGVGYAEKSTTGAVYGFLRHKDGDSDAAWKDETALIPQFAGANADEHISMAVHDNTVLMAVKTSGVAAGVVNIGLLRRHTNGSWFQHAVMTSNVWNRPTLAIDATNNVLCVIASRMGSGGIVRVGEMKKAVIGSYDALATAPIDTIFMHDTDSFLNPSVAAHTVEGTMNLMVCMGNETRNELWYNRITLGGVAKPGSEEPAAVMEVGEENFEGVQVYPNPFNPSTSFRFKVKETPQSRVKLQIFNINGQLVRTLVDRDMAPGIYEQRWNGHTNNGHLAASGIYFYRLQIGQKIWRGRIQIVK